MQNLETVLTNLPPLLLGLGAMSYHGYRGFKEMTENSRLLQFEAKDFRYEKAKAARDILMSALQFFTG